MGQSADPCTAQYGGQEPDQESEHDSEFVHSMLSTRKILANRIMTTLVSLVPPNVKLTGGVLAVRVECLVRHSMNQNTNQFSERKDTP
jgi:hypothetical protein